MQADQLVLLLYRINYHISAEAPQEGKMLKKIFIRFSQEGEF